MEIKSITLANRIELHVHVGPDIRERKTNVWEYVRTARAEGMAAVVIKNHYFPTMVEAAIVALQESGIEVFGGVALNYSVGGLNPHAVEWAIQAGAKIIWMPTHDAELERQYHNQSSTGIHVLNGHGELLDEVREILDKIAANNCVLATGHLSYPEIMVLLQECRHRGVQKMLINHPGIIFQRFTIQQQLEMVKLGAFQEHSYCRPPHTLSPDELAETLTAIDPEFVVLGTDLGQPRNPDPVSGYKEMLIQLVERGISTEDIDKMTIKNPGHLLDIRS